MEKTKDYYSSVRTANILAIIFLLSCFFPVISVILFFILPFPYILNLPLLVFTIGFISFSMSLLSIAKITSFKDWKYIVWTILPLLMIAIGYYSFYHPIKALVPQINF